MPLLLRPDFTYSNILFDDQTQFYTFPQIFAVSSVLHARRGRPLIFVAGRHYRPGLFLDFSSADDASSFSLKKKKKPKTHTAHSVLLKLLLLRTAVL